MFVLKRADIVLAKASMDSDPATMREFRSANGWHVASRFLNDEFVKVVIYPTAGDKQFEYEYCSANGELGQSGEYCYLPEHLRQMFGDLIAAAEEKDKRKEQEAADASNRQELLSLQKRAGPNAHVVLIRPGAIEMAGPERSSTGQTGR
jgi:hypothetical protein